MNETKILNQKLKVGAMIGFITNIVSLIFVVIVIIMLLAAITFNLGMTNTAPVKTASTMAIITIIIGLLIKIAIGSILIIMCNKVLKGKSKNGLALGILTLVLSGLYLISIFVRHFNLISGISIILFGLNTVSGILLIIGKYIIQEKKVVT